MTIRRKQIENLMMWSCVGMAYFNAISTLGLDPASSTVTAALPIALFALWNGRSRLLHDQRLHDQRPHDQRPNKP